MRVLERLGVVPRLPLCETNGLGLRSSAQHSPAAFLASSMTCERLCQQLDPEHTVNLQDGTTDAALALADYNAAVAPEDRLDSAANWQEFSQKMLSERIDARIRANVGQASRNDEGYAAHLELTQGGGKFLHVAPSPNTGNHMDPLLFRTAVMRWVRAPLAQEEGTCPMCDGVLDRYGDHCLVCPCGGDRTKRHNHLRNRVFLFSTTAGLNPELEKPGLLQPRPQISGASESGAASNDPSGRRHADVYVPRWRPGLPMAMDFAVTSGIRQGSAHASIQDPSFAVTAYEDRKRNHLDTARLCSEEGLLFTPWWLRLMGASGAQLLKECSPSLPKLNLFSLASLETLSLGSCTKTSTWCCSATIPGPSSSGCAPSGMSHMISPMLPPPC